MNPFESAVLGEKCYPDLDGIPERVDIVDIFRRSQFVPEIVEAAIRIEARAVWMQEGIVDQESAERAKAAGLEVVMDRCILKDHRRMSIWIGTASRTLYAHRHRAERPFRKIPSASHANA